jgi:hypothetical protein
VKRSKYSHEATLRAVFIEALKCGNADEQWYQYLRSKINEATPARQNQQFFGDDEFMWPQTIRVVRERLQLFVGPKGITTREFPTYPSIVTLGQEIHMVVVAYGLRHGFHRRSKKSTSTIFGATLITSIIFELYNGILHLSNTAIEDARDICLDWYYKRLFETSKQCHHEYQQTLDEVMKVNTFMQTHGLNAIVGALLEHPTDYFEVSKDFRETGNEDLLELIETACAKKKYQPLTHREFQSIKAKWEIEKS